MAEHSTCTSMRDGCRRELLARSYLLSQLVELDIVLSDGRCLRAPETRSQWAVSSNPSASASTIEEMMILVTAHPHPKIF